MKNIYFNISRYILTFPKHKDLKRIVAVQIIECIRVSCELMGELSISLRYHKPIIESYY